MICRIILFFLLVSQVFGQGEVLFSGGSGSQRVTTRSAIKTDILGNLSDILSILVKSSGGSVLLGLDENDDAVLGFNADASGKSFLVVNQATGETIILVPDPAEGELAYWWVDSQDQGEYWALVYGSAEDEVAAYDGEWNFSSASGFFSSFNTDNGGDSYRVRDSGNNRYILDYSATTGNLLLGFNSGDTGGKFQVWDRGGLALRLDMDELGNTQLAGQLEQTGASYANAASPVTAVRETVYYNLDTTAGDVELDLYSCDATVEGALVSVKIVAGTNDAIFDPSGTELVEGGAAYYSFSGSLNSRAFRCNGVGTNPGWWLLDGPDPVPAQSNQFTTGIQLDSDNSDNGDGRVVMTKKPSVGILQMVPNSIGEIYFNTFQFESGNGSGGQTVLGTISNEGMNGVVLGGKASFNQFTLRKSNYNNAGSPYTLDQFYAVAYVDTTAGNVEFELPSCASATEGFEFHFKITDGAFSVILDPNGSQEIEGSATSHSFSGVLEARTIRCEGSGAGEGWWVF